jgi:hypothetical protein
VARNVHPYCLVVRTHFRSDDEGPSCGVKPAVQTGSTEWWDTRM